MTKVLADYRAGHRDEAFAALVGRYEPQLRRVIARKLGRLRNDLRTDEDVTQSVFFRLAREMDDNRTWIRDMTGTETLEKVLNHLATMKAVDAVRKANRLCRRDTVTDQHAGGGPDDARLSETLPDTTADPVGEVDAHLTTAEMSERVAAVNPRWVPIFEARLEGLSVPEIVEKVGGSKRSVELALHGIKNALRQWADTLYDQLEADE